VFLTGKQNIPRRKTKYSSQENFVFRVGKKVFPRYVRKEKNSSLIVGLKILFMQNIIRFVLTNSLVHKDMLGSVRTTPLPHPVIMAVTTNCIPYP